MQKLGGEVPEPELVSPTQRDFRWWTLEDGVLHWADDEPAFCASSGAYEFDEKGLGKITRQGHDTPQLDCMCGYWIYHAFEGARDYYNPGYSYDPAAKYVYGLNEHVQPICVVIMVWGYGKWLVNEETFRSQYMKFAAIQAVEGYEWWTQMIAEDYGVPHLPINELKDYQKQAGASGLEIWRSRNHGTTQGQGNSW